MYFRTYGLSKTWLDKCLKSPVSEDPLTGNMLNGWKHCFNLNDSALTIFLITVIVIELENVSLRDMQNFKTIYSHINCR